MQTFKQFLLERRSRAIGLDDAKAWMERNASEYLDNGVFLYRGIKGEDATSAMYANTDEGDVRKSIGGMANYYTLWMSHHPAWRGKPRRERAFICSSSPEHAKTWGHLHLVVPGDGAKVGSVGADDIWNKFIAPDLRVAQLTNSTQSVLAALVSRAEVEDPDMTFAQLAAMMKSITLEEVVAQNKKKYMLMSGMHGMLDLVQGSEGTLYDLWEAALDPSKFDFMDGGSIRPGEDDSEYWVDGSALYIPLRNFDEDYTKGLLELVVAEAPKLARDLKKYWK